MNAQDKRQWRARILAARRRRTPEERRSDALALSHALSDSATEGTTVAAYVPIGSEPGGVEMLDVLLRSRVRVLLPVVGDPASPMRWAEYAGPQSLVEAAHGLREPEGPRLPPDTLVHATVVLVPALAVDRQGVRLGRGAGFYDRTLHLAKPGAALVGVVFDDELVDRLPSEPHDRPMTHVLTPSGGMASVRPE